MDHWLSLYTRIVALIEALREREVTLKPSGLGALQSLVTSFCVQVGTASSDVKLSPLPTPTGLSWSLSQGWEKARERVGLCLDTIEEEGETDTFSIPDSLPELVDNEGEEECLSSIGLVEGGVVPPGIVLHQDSVRFNRFWLQE